MTRILAATRLLLGFWTVTALCHAQPIAPCYEIFDLGTLSGYRSNALSINDHGQVVGYVCSTEDATVQTLGCAYATGAYSLGPSRAVLFDPTGLASPTPLGSLAGDGYVSRAYSINNLGQIVGYSQSSYAWSRCHATLFEPVGDGGYSTTDLGALMGGIDFESHAHAISDNGRIVGWSYSSSGGSYATVFDRSGSNAYLTSFGGVGHGQAYAVNDGGEMVGWCENNGCEATLFLGTASKVDLMGAFATSINEQGQIVGRTDRAVLFDPTGGGENVDLGTVAGYAFSNASSINDHGHIVGWAYNYSSPSSLSSTAVLFDPTGSGENIDLNELIDSDSGWTLQYANDINNSGWIVGQGINPNGSTRAFLLVPVPEPASLGILALGGMAAASRQRSFSTTRPAGKEVKA